MLLLLSIKQRTATLNRFCLTKFESIAINVIQEIQLLEFMGEESKLTHAHSNCLFCMFFIRIYGKCIYICTLWNSKVSVDIPEYFIGASLSGPHTSELNGGFSIYVYKYIYIYQRVGRLSM